MCLWAVTTNRTFSLLFTYYASVSQPGDLHYSYGADPSSSASSTGPCWVSCYPSLMSRDEPLSPWQEPDRPLEPRRHMCNPCDIASSCSSSKMNGVRNTNVTIHWMSRARDVPWVRPKFSETPFYRPKLLDVTRLQAWRKALAPVPAVRRSGIFHLSGSV